MIPAKWTVLLFALVTTAISASGAKAEAQRERADQNHLAYRD